jgi:hypothetical protein
MLSKNGFANRTLVEWTTYMATCLFNEGKIPILDVLFSLGVPIGNRLVEYCRKQDELRGVKKNREAEARL